MPFDLLNPAGLEKPVGYSHVAKISSGRIVFVAGQAPFDASGAVVGKGDFVAQFHQVMRNLKLAIEGAGGRPRQFAVLTMYLTDLQAYMANKKAIGAAYREVFGKYFPAITLVEVKGLYNPECMIEISGVAVID
jgi:enamine deaminase RidA (YjgF/YER057c/UK114 family)